MNSRVAQVAILGAAICASGTAGPPPHAEAAKKKAIQTTINSHESSDYGFFDLSYVKVVDLSQPFEESLDLNSEEGECTPARTGTILHGGGQYVDTRRSAELPLELLMGPAVVIDVSRFVEENPSFVVGSKFFSDWEADRERIPKNAYVLFYTGWADKWGDDEEYTATGSDGKPAYPTIAADLGRMLVKGRKVFGIGIDAPCPDGGTGGVHQHAEPLEIIVLENLANLKFLPEQGAWVTAFPPKLDDAPAVPARVIAFVRPDEVRPAFVDD